MNQQLFSIPSHFKKGNKKQYFLYKSSCWNKDRKVKPQQSSKHEFFSVEFSRRQRSLTSRWVHAVKIRLQIDMNPDWIGTCEAREGGCLKGGSIKRQRRKCSISECNNSGYTNISIQCMCMLGAKTQKNFTQTKILIWIRHQYWLSEHWAVNTHAHQST